MKMLDIIDIEGKFCVNLSGDYPEVEEDVSNFWVKLNRINIEKITEKVDFDDFIAYLGVSGAAYEEIKAIVKEWDKPRRDKYIEYRRGSPAIPSAAFWVKHNAYHSGKHNKLIDLIIKEASK